MCLFGMDDEEPEMVEMVEMAKEQPGLKYERSETMVYPASEDGQEPEPELSSWIVNYNRNCKKSRLVRLPEVLILKIMHLADPADLYMLRQTSYTFFHLFFRDRFFKPLHKNFRLGRDRISIFNISATPRPDEIVDRATRLNLCNECHAAKMDKASYKDRMSAVLAPQACGSCGFHSRLHFRENKAASGASAPQKRCISWEGTVGLCKHRSISLSAVTRSASKSWNALPPALRKTLVRCDTCFDISMKDVARSGRSRRTVPPSFTLTLDKSWSGDLRFKGDIKWTLPVCTVEMDQHVTDGFLMKKLADLKQSHGERLLCPHFTFDDNRLLRAFDPRHCSCLGDDTRAGGPFGVDGVLAPEIHCARGTCKAVSKAGLMVGTLQREREFMEDGAEYGFDHAVICDICSAVYNWVRHHRVVFLQLFQDIDWAVEDGSTKFGRCSRMVDPASNAAHTEGSLSKNILWCEDRKCRNGRDGTRLAMNLGCSLK